MFRGIVTRADKNGLVESLCLGVFCGWYDVVARCLASSSAQSVAKNSLTKLGSVVGQQVC